MTDTLNNQQQEGLGLAVEWYNDRKKFISNKPFFFLSGVAGSGKTFLAKHIANQCCGMSNSVFMAPTGKAASRLKQKGCSRAQTMHHFIYNFMGESDDGDLIFHSKKQLEEQPKLIVLDEAMMVGMYDADKILSHNISLLALGDLHQLPPVKDSPFFNKNNVDYMLTQIERQKENSNIVRASVFVRDGYSLPVREYGDVAVRDGKPNSKLLVEYSENDSQIICSRNATRQSYNTLIRTLRGHVGSMPCIGEKLVCVFNQHKYDFMNGEQCILLGLEPLPGYELDDNDLSGLMKARVLSLTNNKEIKIKFNPDSFSVDPEARQEALKHVGGLDFGYVLTVHKSQGSEWPNVMILDEKIPSIPYRLMMYTAITRAINKLIIYRNQ